MFFEKNGKRAQTSIEYMLIIAMTIALVAAIMVTGFRELELDLVLGAARMGGVDYTAINSNYTLGRIDFIQNNTTNIIQVTPHFYLRRATTVSSDDFYGASTSCFLKMRSVFRPLDTGVTSDFCFDATYWRYCVTPIMTRA